LIKISAESEVSESRGEKSGGFVVAVTEREVCEGMIKIASECEVSERRRERRESD
jgi:hypothetical protein